MSLYLLSEAAQCLWNEYPNYVCAIDAKMFKSCLKIQLFKTAFDNYL